MPTAENSMETIVGGIVSSTITTRSTKAIHRGDDGRRPDRNHEALDQVPELKPARGHNAVYVFALP